MLPMRNDGSILSHINGRNGPIKCAYYNSPHLTRSFCLQWHVHPAMVYLRVCTLKIIWYIINKRKNYNGQCALFVSLAMTRAQFYFQKGHLKKCLFCVTRPDGKKLAGSNCFEPVALKISQYFFYFPILGGHPKRFSTPKVVWRSKT